MKDVVFVMSGYQNPQRSNLRDMMLDMGAKYKQDWEPSCTHLICAFTNTPKFLQVKGKGKIVTAKWITDCHKNKIRYPWRRYQLERDRNADESEEEVWAEELLPKEERRAKPNTNTTNDNTATTAIYTNRTMTQQNQQTSTAHTPHLAHANTPSTPPHHAHTPATLPHTCHNHTHRGFPEVIANKITNTMFTANISNI
ncbi:putative DNA repair protein XRCC1 isoform X1 [Penaeus vannamei]|uniref:Putative DNA repair protein XRCC1 isoform X1 n=1 Tax=Penaeus vannamei TaxID=6689 RepID=A0A3R7Q1W5_PENVA|nr:putative DNA repair protein XRCC1 isoform X1 [Penaeus vannamei]